MAKTPKPPTGCQIKNGRFYRVLYVGIVGGKRKHEWVPLTRVNDGLPALYRALADLGSRPPATSRMMKPRLDAWLVDALPGLSAAEQKEQARMAARIAKQFIEFNTTELQARHIHSFLRQWANVGKLRTAQRYRDTLNKFFKWVIIQGDRQDNPVEPVSTAAPQHNMRHMDDDAFRWIRGKLLGDDGHKAASGEMMQVYVDLSYLTGHGGIDMRLLRWSQIDESAKLIPVTRSKVRRKTGATVDIHITPAIRRVLDGARELMKGKARLSPYVVHNLNGEPYSAHGVNTAWRRARQRAFAEHPERPDLLTFTLKDLRAKFATDAKAQGYTDEQIAAGMAHIDTSTTTVYLKKRMAKKSNISLEIPK